MAKQTDLFHNDAKRGKHRVHTAFPNKCAKEPTPPPP